MLVDKIILRLKIFYTRNFKNWLFDVKLCAKLWENNHIHENYKWRIQQLIFKCRKLLHCNKNNIATYLSDMHQIYSYLFFRKKTRKKRTLLIEHPLLMSLTFSVMRLCKKLKYLYFDWNQCLNWTWAHLKKVLKRQTFLCFENNCVLSDITLCVWTTGHFHDIPPYVNQ